MSTSELEVSESEGEAALPSMPKFEESDTPVLVAIIRECQKKGYAGTSGDWKTFVNANKGKLGDGYSDPKRQSFAMLAGFVSSMAGHHKRVKMAKRHIRHALQIREEHEACSRGEEAGAAESFAEGSEWPGIVDLVDRCKKNAYFSANYTFPSSERGWRRVQRVHFDYGQSPRLVAIDCEMCVTDKEDKALVKVTAVDRDGMVLLDRLVRPTGAVRNWKTEITGITESQLQEVKYGRRDARRDLLKVLGSPACTVLVGHSLHNDLRALRLDWEPVIDTALLFQYKSLPRATVSLAHLTSVFLNETLRTDDSAHDSTEDAKATMAIINHTLAESPAFVIPPPDIKVDKAEQSKLMVFEIPQDISLEDIRKLLHSASTPIIDVVEELTSSKRRRMYVTFSNPAQANAAFEALPGSQMTDSLGRFLKQVHFVDNMGKISGLQTTGISTAVTKKRKADWKGDGMRVKVRKMAGHNGRMYGTDITGRQEQRRR